jgi:hypothetical protein
MPYCVTERSRGYKRLQLYSNALVLTVVDIGTVVSEIRCTLTLCLHCMYFVLIRTSFDTLNTSERERVSERERECVCMTPL